MHGLTNKYIRHRAADQAATRILRACPLGACPPENFGFLEAQISYFHHFEEFSNKKLTL
jgi:hypothetical protein